MPINADWHKAHPMPARPTAAQRLTWHLEHAKACGCRALTAEMRKRLAAAAKAEVRQAAAKGKAAAKRRRRT